MRLATEDIDLVFNTIEYLLVEEGMDFFENGLASDETLVAYTDKFGEIYFTRGESDSVESTYAIDVLHAGFEDTSLEDRFIAAFDKHMQQVNPDTEYEITMDERAGRYDDD